MPAGAWRGQATSTNGACSGDRALKREASGASPPRPVRVDAERARAGDIDQNETAQYREVLREVRILSDPLGIRRLPEAMRNRCRDDHIDNAQDRAPACPESE